jgi:hypothetical protein
MTRTVLCDAGVHLRTRQRLVVECGRGPLVGLRMDDMAGELRETGIAVMPDRERQG